MNSERMRELALGGVILALAIVGLVIGVVRSEVAIPEAEVGTDDPYIERSLFCAPLGEAEGQVASGTATHVSAPVAEPVLVGVEPDGDAPTELDAEVLSTELAQARATAFTGFGASLDASSILSLEGPTPGWAAGRCSKVASDKWFFPYGSSDRGFNEWLILHNPFPDEAVARINFLTQGGVRTPARVSDLAVPAGRTTVVKINEVLLQTEGLGVEVVTLRGRVVAWEAMFTQVEGLPPGAGLTLGATEPAADWYLPAGSVGGGQEERIAVLNPSDEEAIVTISLITDKQALQPSGLVEVSIPARTSREFDLRKQLDGEDVGGTSVAVRSVNETPIVVERANWYSEEGFRGFTLEMGVAGGGEEWWVGPATLKPERDALVLMNTGEEESRVDIELLGEGVAPVSGEELSGIVLPPGGRVRIDLTGLVNGPSVAIVTADAPIAVERIAYSGDDVATVMGSPIEP